MNRFSVCGTFSGRSTSAFSTLKTTALAPMARASVKTAVMANPGALRSWRRARRMSAFILPPCVQGARAWLCLARSGWCRRYAGGGGMVPMDFGGWAFVVSLREAALEWVACRELLAAAGYVSEIAVDSYSESDISSFEYEESIRTIPAFVSRYTACAAGADRWRSAWVR